MTIVNIHEAKTHLSKLIERARNGEEIMIANNGRPVARLSPIASDRTERRPGAWKDGLWIADDFNAPLPPEVLSAFDGGDQ